jgi:hypothetical protein
MATLPKQAAEPRVATPEPRCRVGRLRVPLGCQPVHLLAVIAVQWRIQSARIQRGSNSRVPPEVAIASAAVGALPRQRHPEGAGDRGSAPSKVLGVVLLALFAGGPDSISARDGKIGLLPRPLSRFGPTSFR